MRRAPESARFDLLSARPAIRELAVRASTELDAALDALGTVERAWLDELPLTAGVQALGAWRADQSYGRVPPAFQSVLARLRSQGGEAWERSYLRLLLYSRLVRLPQHTPPIRVPESVWHTTETGLGTLLDALPAYTEGAWLEADALKDLAVASLRAVCIGSRLLEPVRVRPWRVASRSPLRQRLGLMRYLRMQFARRGRYTTIHAWRGYREARSKERWEILYLPVADITEANPDMVGVFERSWLLDPGLRQIAPHLAARADGLRAMGAFMFKIGVNERSTEFALRTSETRRRLYAAGKYVPTEWGTITKRSLLAQWARAYRARFHDALGEAR